MAKSSVREYAILYVGGKKSVGGGTAGGGNVLLNAGQHALDGPEHTGQLPADRVSVADVGGLYVATDTEAALAEVATDIVALQSDFIAKAIVDAKGDIIAATAADTVARVAVGANDYVLTADSTQSAGVKWAAPTGAGHFLTIASSHSTPLVFDDIVQSSAGDDFIYSS